MALEAVLLNTPTVWSGCQHKACSKVGAYSSNLNPIQKFDQK